VKCIPLLLVVFAWPACAQFSGLSATGDGSSLYFSSHLRFRGSADSFDAKLFRTSGQTPALFQSQQRGEPIGWTWDSFYDLVAPQVSTDGSTIAYTGVRPCYGGSGCLGVQTAQGILADSNGKALLSEIGYVNLSPNAQYALFFGRNTFAHMVPPAELISVATGARTTVPYPISTQARRRVANDGTVAIFDWGVIRLWQVSGEQTLTGLSIVAPLYTGAEPLLFLSADARRLVYQTPKGLARYDRTAAAEEILTSAAPTSVSIDDYATVVAYVDPADSQIHLAAPPRQLTHEAEGISEVALSGDGRVAFAVTRMGRLLRIEVASGALNELVPRTPSITNPMLPGVVASVFGVVSPGSLVPLIGLGLSASTEVAAPPLPSMLADVRVRIAGMDAAIQSVSPETVWLQVPWELPEQQAARFELLSGNSPFETAPGTVDVQTLAPHIFTTVDTTNGYNVYDVAVHQDWSGLITPASPARGGEIITLYFNGLGPVTPAVATGEAAPALNPAWVTGPFRCQFWDGGPNDSQLYFAGLAPEMVGVYQVSLQVPAGLRMSPVTINCDFGAGTPYGFGQVFVVPTLSLNAPIPPRRISDTAPSRRPSRRASPP
jgi:uncharacterized protein (TIGR03437 family)